MRAEVVKRVGMVAVIPILLAIILVTPSLMGRPAAPLSAIPALIIGLTESEVVLDIHGAVDQYRYESIYVHIQAEDGPFSWSQEKLQAYDLDHSFSRNLTLAFDLYVLILDRQDSTYALNGTVFTGHDSSGDYVAMTDRGSWRTTLVYTPADLRALIPRGVGP